MASNKFKEKLLYISKYYDRVHINFFIEKKIHKYLIITFQDFVISIAYRIKENIHIFTTSIMTLKEKKM